MPRKTPKRRRSVAFPDQDEAQDIPAVEEAQPSGGPDKPIDITDNADQPEPPAEGEPADGPPVLSEKELALISTVCNNFWSSKKVQGYFWFEQVPGKLVMHNSQQTTQLADRVSGWNVPYSIVEEELRRQNVSATDLSCVGVFHPLTVGLCPACVPDSRPRLTSHSALALLSPRGSLPAPGSRAARPTVLSRRRMKLSPMSSGVSSNCEGQ